MNDQKILVNASPDSRRAGPSQRDMETGEKILIRDLMQREGIHLDVHSDRASPEDILIRGRRDSRELRRGLFLRRGDTLEEYPFTSTSSQPPGLSCIFFLRGRVDARFGERLLRFHGGPAAAAIVRGTTERFERIGRGPQRVRNLVITATPEWLDFNSGEEVQGKRLSKRLLDRHFQAHHWAPTPGLLERLGELFAPPDYTPELQNLYLEGRAVALVAEAIAQLLREERRREDGDTLNRHDSIRLRRARDLIATNPGLPLSVDSIAREAGVSASGLQRLFRRAEGISVFEYVRRERLQQALAALRSESASVQEASAIAGYTSPANFATAFKRRFGFSPREARRN